MLTESQRSREVYESLDYERQVRRISRGKYCIKGSRLHREGAEEHLFNSQTSGDSPYAHAKLLCRREIACLVLSTLSSKGGKEDQKEYSSQVGVMQC